MQLFVVYSYQKPQCSTKVKEYSVVHNFIDNIIINRQVNGRLNVRL